MNSITDRISLTDEEIEARFEKLGIGLGLGYGGEDNVVVTNDTIQNFIDGRKEWAEPGVVTINDGTSLVVERGQPRRGMQRDTLYVVDFGDVRLAVR